MKSRLFSIAVAVVIFAGCGDNEPPPLCTELQCTPTCEENPCLHFACDCTCVPDGLDHPVACLYEHKFPHP